MTRAHRLSFLKVLAAMAWADGEVQEEERNRIKILFNEFDLDPADRKQVDALLERPVTFDRALDLTKDFAGRVSLPGARKELLEELETLVGADRQRTPEETELLEHFRAILASHTVVDGLVEKMRGLFSRTLFSGRGKKAGEGSLTEFARNSALQRLRDLHREHGEDLDTDLDAWNRVTLLGVLMANVARLAGKPDPERAVVERVLDGQLHMSPTERELLLIVVQEEHERDTDLQRVCAEYCRVSTMEERLEIVDALFTIGAADGTISKDEVERIRHIADLLWISNPEYLSIRDHHRSQIET
ncbi:MAG: hypothetical protein HKN12_10670 [Gemmatimonadetes bacterium]|nr:hypothetical protein [Gemmatimonadota bacterium]